MMEESFESKRWFRYLDHSMQDLVRVSLKLVAREEQEENGFHDYSFVVFPMAKAYEGFLKKVFLEMGLVDERVLGGKHFRVGKSLNPDLPEKYRGDDWVVEKLRQECGGRRIEGLVEEMWEGWKRGRNLLFHYWPRHENFIDLSEAKLRVEELVAVIERVVEEGLVGG